MTPREQAGAVLREFGAVIGIPGLAFDGTNSCCLVFDGSITVTIAVEERAGRMLLFAYLGDAPSVGGAGALGALLEGNFLWRETAGATIALEAGSRSVVLLREMPLDGLDAGRFQREVEGFVNAAEHWMGRLRLLDDRDGLDDDPAPLDFPQALRV